MPDLTPAQKEALKTGVLARFVRLDHPDGVIRMSSLPVDWADGGVTWLGGARVLEFGDSTSSGGVESESFAVTWNGATQALIAAARDGKIVKSTLTHWIGLLSGDPLALVGDMIRTFRGVCETPDINLDARQPTISVTAESVMMKLGRNREYRFDPSTLRRHSPDDTFFDGVAAIQDTDPFG